MSTIKIRIESNRMRLGIVRTEVFVDNKFAYQSANHPNVEKEKLDILIKLIPIENTETEIK